MLNAGHCNRGRVRHTLAPDMYTHELQGNRDAIHGPASKRRIAVEVMQAGYSGHQTDEEPNSGARVPAVQGFARRTEALFRSSHDYVTFVLDHGGTELLDDGFGATNILAIRETPDGA